MSSTSSLSDPVVIVGGIVVDPDDDAGSPRSQDIRIERGRIAATGVPGSLGSSDNARIIDAHGMLVTPGFVNAHYHSHDVLLRGMFEQMPLECWVLGSSPANYPRTNVEEVRARTLIGAAENLRSGITACQDMVTIVAADREHRDTILSAYEETGIRVVLALQMSDRAVADTVPFWREELSQKSLLQLRQGSDFGPMRQLVEEVLTSEQSRSDRIRLALGPSAPQRCSESTLTWMACAAEQYSLRLFTHLYETKSQAVLARMAYQNDGHSLISYIDRMSLLNDRLSIAHGVWITDNEISRLARAGASVILNPVSNLKLLNGVAPVRRYLDAGVGVAIGCDNCSGSDAQNIFEAMKAFALWYGFQSKPGESGAARQAFKAATLGGAKALGLENEVGAFRRGMRADLVLLNLADPSFVPLNDAIRQLVYAATPRAVHAVLAGGEVVLADNCIRSFAEKAVHDIARKIQGAIREQSSAIVARTSDLAQEILGIHRRIDAYPLEIGQLRLS